MQLKQLSCVCWQVAQLEEQPTHYPSLLTSVKEDSSHSNLQKPVVACKDRFAWHAVQKVGEPLHVTHEESQGTQVSPTAGSTTRTETSLGQLATQVKSIVFSFIPALQVVHWSLLPEQVRQLSLQSSHSLERESSSATQPLGHSDLHSKSWKNLVIGSPGSGILQLKHLSDSSVQVSQGS